MVDLAVLAGKALGGAAAYGGKKLAERALAGRSGGTGSGSRTHPTEFQGRATDVAVLREIILRDGNNFAAICAVQGLGGIGKTRLAEHVGGLEKDQFPDGVHTFNLMGTTQAVAVEQVMASVLTALDPVYAVTDPDALRAHYHQRLAGKRMLLILDNARDTAHVEALLPPQPVACIVTSRQRIGLANIHCLDLDELDRNGARALLRQFIDENRADDAELDALAEACARLPLALETAGKYLKSRPTYPFDRYLARLKEHRAKSLDAVFASLRLTYDWLVADNPDLAAKWPLLSVFASGFEPEFVETICAVEDGLDFLEDLSAFGLVLPPDEDFPSYRLHDLMRDVAKQVADDAELEAAGRRHVERFTLVLGEANKRYLNKDVLDGLQMFDRARAEIEAAFSWLQARIDTDDEAARGCAKLVNAGASVLALRHSPMVRIDWLDAHLRSARKIGDRQGEGNALGNLGIAWAALGEVRKAVEYYEQALVIARKIGDRQGEGAALGNLGNVWAALSETRKAVEYHEQHLVIAREIGDRRGEGNALGNLGNAWAALGEVRKAVEYYEQRIVIAREIGDRRGEGNALGNLGNAWAALGEARKAVEYHEQNLVIAREIGDRRGEVNAFGSLGNAWAALGEIHKAVEYYEKALVIAREIGDRQGEGNAFGGLGNAWAALGKTHNAVEYYEQQIVIAREIGDRLGEAIAYYNMAREAWKAGEKDVALRRMAEALAIFEAIESRHAETARAVLEEWRGGGG